MSSWKLFFWNTYLQGNFLLGNFLLGKILLEITYGKLPNVFKSTTFKFLIYLFIFIIANTGREKKKNEVREEGGREEQMEVQAKKMRDFHGCQHLMFLAFITFKLNSDVLCALLLLLFFSFYIQRTARVCTEWSINGPTWKTEVVDAFSFLCALCSLMSSKMRNEHRNFSEIVIK